MKLISHAPLQSNLVSNAPGSYRLLTARCFFSVTNMSHAYRRQDQAIHGQCMPKDGHSHRSSDTDFEKTGPITFNRNLQDGLSNSRIRRDPSYSVCFLLDWLVFAGKHMLSFVKARDIVCCTTHGSGEVRYNLCFAPSSPGYLSSTSIWRLHLRIADCSSQRPSTSAHSPEYSILDNRDHDCD
jgi:hypothetical protein